MVTTYVQIPFQYSLHYIENEGGALKHREFLARPGRDSRREIAERLCKDIPANVCVTAYHKSFECGRLNELAALFPQEIIRKQLLDYCGLDTFAMVKVWEKLLEVAYAHKNERSG